MLITDVWNNYAVVLNYRAKWVSGVPSLRYARINNIIFFKNTSININNSLADDYVIEPSYETGRYIIKWLYENMVM